jgi:hypothetical protein
MAYPGASITLTVGGVTNTYNLLSSNASSGLWAVQNVTPTFVQAKAGSAPDNEVQPFAEIAYSDWTGSIGLYERTSDPGDFSRPFLSTCDTSKPRQLTGNPATKAAASTIGAPGIDTAGTAFAWVDSQLGPGFVAKKSGSATYGYWRWNEATFAWDFIRDVQAGPQTLNGSSVCRAITGSQHPPLQTVTQYGNSLWMAIGGGTPGLTDIGAAAALPAGAGAITGAVHSAKFFDQLFVFAFVSGNISITALSGSPLTVTQSIAADGTKSNNSAVIYGEANLMGVVAWDGALWIFTDKSLYTAQWIEATNVLDIQPQIVGTAKFTSNPVVYQNELWVGADNQLWHMAAHQTNNDFKPIDIEGWLSSPFNGRITELHPFTQVLVAKVVKPAGTTGASDCALLRYTALGSWQFSTPCDGYTPSGVVSPAFRTQDGTNLPSIHYFSSSGGTQCGAVFESGQNVRTLTTGTAVVNAGLLVTPWEYGNTRTAQKQLLRSRAEVENTLGATVLYYQTDNNNKQADSPAFTGVGQSGLGAWKKAVPNLGASVAGDAGSALDSTGTGVLWAEYDGSNGADWHGATAYPTFKRLRHAFFIEGGSVPTIPALLSFAWHRLEYAFKFYVINTTLMLEVHEDDPSNPALYSTPDDLVGAVAILQAADYNKSIITAVGPDNVTYKCVISKFLSNYTIIDPDGPKRAVVQLTLQSAKLYGLAV